MDQWRCFVCCSTFDTTTFPFSLSSTHRSVAVFGPSSLCCASFWNGAHAPRERMRQAASRRVRGAHLPLSGPPSAPLPPPPSSHLQTHTDNPPDATRVPRTLAGAGGPRPVVVDHRSGTLGLGGSRDRAHMACDDAAVSLGIRSTDRRWTCFRAAIAMQQSHKSLDWKNGWEGGRRGRGVCADGGRVFFTWTLVPRFFFFFFWVSFLAQTLKGFSLSRSFHPSDQVGERANSSVGVGAFC